jgi:hypothetical protein
MRNIALAAGVKVVETDHLVAFVQQSLAKMRTQESSAACYQYALTADPLHVVGSPSCS